MAEFCTLFDSRFLSRGLALHASLRRFGSHRLYILPMDDHALKILQELALPGVTLIPHSVFENDALRRVRPQRTAGEYCWTCTSHLLAYCLREFGLAACTYVDADLWFFQDPQSLLDEAASSSVLLTEHRYAEGCDQTDLSGRYCVQFMTFRNDAQGRSALDWWCERCIEWCFARREDGKFGDQKYLDDWTDRFGGVHVLANEGGGVAPWNVARYSVRRDAAKVTVCSHATRRVWPLVFFHFHALRFYDDGFAALCGGDTRYRLNRAVRDFIYRPYLQELAHIGTALRQRYSHVNIHGVVSAKRWSLRGMLRAAALVICGRYDYVRINRFTRSAELNAHQSHK